MSMWFTVNLTVFYIRTCTHVNKHMYVYWLIITFVFTQRCIKKHFKMVKGCRVDTGLCKKALSKKDLPTILGTRVSCETGAGLGGQSVRQA